MAGKKIKNKIQKNSLSKKREATAEKKNAAKKAMEKNDNKICEYDFIDQIKINKGALIMQPGSSKKYKTGEWRTYKPAIDLAKCIKCGQCWMVCPDASIFQRKQDGKYEINHAYCKGCLLCEKVCPVKAIDHELEDK